MKNNYGEIIINYRINSDEELIIMSVRVPDGFANKVLSIKSVLIHPYPTKYIVEELSKLNIIS